jgi:hypothetical protein
MAVDRSVLVFWIPTIRFRLCPQQFFKTHTRRLSLVTPPVTACQVLGGMRAELEDPATPPKTLEALCAIVNDDDRLRDRLSDLRQELESRYRLGAESVATVEAAAERVSGRRAMVMGGGGEGGGRRGRILKDHPLAPPHEALS